jgi:putative hydrolase of the HAD superfamily
MFDLGGVIVDFSEQKYVRYMVKRLGLDYKYMLEVIDRKLPLLETARINQTEYESYCVKMLGLKSRSQLEWSKGFNTVANTDYDVLNLARELHKRYRTALITNISRSRYATACRNKFDKSVFDRRFTSYGLRIKKPDKRIYEIVLNRMGANPEETVFIDNMRENVDGAESIGIHGIVFKNYKQLIRDLRNIGVI